MGQGVHLCSPGGSLFDVSPNYSMRELLGNNRVQIASRFFHWNTRNISRSRLTLLGRCDVSAVIGLATSPIPQQHEESRVAWPLVLAPHMAPLGL